MPERALRANDARPMALKLTGTESVSDPRDTPAMRQYLRFKKAHPDCLLLFRIGDFYEMFDDDAVAASKAIGLTLTQRSAGIPMAGVPHHQVEVYIRKLMLAGFRVAVCDQTQDAAQAKGIVDRAVTRVITPGTAIDESLLESDHAAALAALCFPSGEDGPACLAVAEFSTGAFTLFACAAEHVGDELLRRGVSEVLFAEAVSAQPPPRVREAFARLKFALTPRPQWHFRAADAREAVLAQFGVLGVGGFGIREDEPSLAAAGALLRYLRETQPGADANAPLKHLRPPRLERSGAGLFIDATSLRALEIDRTIRGGSGLGAAPTATDAPGGDGSLVGIFASKRAACRTPMGRRLLRAWLCRPLCELEAIRARQRVVSVLVEDRRLADEIGGALKPVQDVQRIGTRAALGRGTPRDLCALAASLRAVGTLAALCTGTPALEAPAREFAASAVRLTPLAERIGSACVDSPPGHLREGGLIRDGVDAALDEARALRTDAGAWLSAYQARLIDTHSLPNLKVGYNKVFGYFIELPKAQAQSAPLEFTRKQTLTGAERYVTPELKGFEDKATHAEARALEREQALFVELCGAVTAELESLARFAMAAAELDALLCFADKAAARRWVCPTVVAEPLLDIRQGRHPVLDEVLDGSFVPNDATLGAAVGPGDDEENAAPLALITGPNMAGKSTFIRQCALLTILAHTGSFVPATSATIGLCDRVFTRVGADDALFAGQSTFMVEMTETANILHHATPASLIVLDEIGRGTSTLDGLSLAWAIAETLAEPPATTLAATKPRGPRTLFATHYHELTQLSELFPGRVRNLHVAVREWEDQIIFLHRIVPGRADRSYGIHVAKLAGIPPRTIARAREVLDSLTVEHNGVAASLGSDGSTLRLAQERASSAAEASTGADSAGQPPVSSKRGHAKTERNPVSGAGQLGLFAAPPHPVVTRLRGMDAATLTPAEALDLLRALKLAAE
ncbi:DNA mismatch repair protein MutS [soil metagenome]